MSLLRPLMASVMMSAALLVALPVVAQDDPLVAKVNGEEIRRSEVTAFTRSLGQQVQGIPPGQLDQIVINELINQKLYLAEAEKAGLRDDPEIQDRIEANVEAVLRDAWLFGEAERRMSDERLQEAYDRVVASSPSGEEIRARHILVETEEEAAALIDQLDDGADFAELARAESTGPTGPQGGDLGYFTKGTMVPAFAEAAFSLAPGSYSEAPVQTQFGWHVIKVEDRRDAAPPSFDAVADQLRLQVRQQVIGEIVNELRAGAEIEIIESDAGAGSGAGAE